MGLGRTYGCRCGILYAPMLGVVFYAGLVSLTSSYPSPCSPYSSEIIGGGFLFGGPPPGFCYVCVGMAQLFYGSGLAENYQNLKMATIGRNM